MFSFEQSGSFDHIEAFLKRFSNDQVFRRLEKYGKEGVDALERATPVDSRLTAKSWDYEVIVDSRSYSIVWRNSNVVDGTPVVVLIQFGHADRGGGWVEGRDFINPALQPVFDRMVDEFWKEATR